MVATSKPTGALTYTQVARSMCMVRVLRIWATTAQQERQTGGREGVVRVVPSFETADKACAAGVVGSSGICSQEGALRRMQNA